MGKTSNFNKIKQWLMTSGGKWYNSWFLKNIYCAGALILVLVLVFSLLLGVVTRHNQEIIVPEFTNTIINDANLLAKRSHLKLAIIDSIFIPRVAPGLVLKQSPRAGNKVKKNRRILITINSESPKMVKMPALVGYFLRQAHSQLTTSSLRVGKLIYVPDIASNNVLSQLYNGKPIESGASIPSESEIDLKLGLGSDDNTTYIPDLSNVTYSSVKAILVDNSLNIGRAIFDRTIESYTDSIEAVIYKQVPEASTKPVPLGTSVTIYLKPGAR